MEITISIEGNSPRAIALGRAMDAYNQRNTPLNEEQFLLKLVEGQLDGLVASYVTTKVTKLAFLDRFTPQETAAILTAAKSSVAVEAYLLQLNSASEVDLTSSRTTGGVAALEAAGLIGAGRGAEILAL